MNKSIITLTNKRDFANLFEKNNLFFKKSNFFTIKYKFNNLEKMRYAIIAKKKLFKTAVLRNKIKRQIRSIITLFDEIKKIDLFIIIRETYNISNWLENKKELIELYKKI